MRRFQVSVTLIAFSLFSGAATAQLKPQTTVGTIIPVKPTAVDQQRFGEVRKEFARCVFSRAKPKAKALLEHSDISTVDLNGAQIRDIHADLDLDECLGEQVTLGESELGMSTHEGTLRDLLAEEAYLSAHRLPPVLPPDAPALAFTLLPTNQEPARAQALAAFADCTVLHDVAGVDALLRTMPGSEQEKSKAAALAPAMGACLFAGQQLSLNPGNIRALMAYAMWTRFRS